MELYKRTTGQILSPLQQEAGRSYKGQQVSLGEPLKCLSCSHQVCFNDVWRSVVAYMFQVLTPSMQLLLLPMTARGIQVSDHLWWQVASLAIGTVKNLCDGVIILAYSFSTESAV